VEVEMTGAPAAPPSSGPPASDIEWKQRLHAALMELGLAFTADAVEHSSVAASAAELAFTTPEEFMLAMRADDINQAVRKILGRPMKVKVAAGKPVEQAVAAPKPPNEDETSERALKNPEVKRFQEIFGGQVRTVRNLKE
jgi:hypothetical protein